MFDVSAIINQIPLCRCAYGPYARSMMRVCKEESFHQRPGYDLLIHMCLHGTQAQKDMCQEAFNRWWWPALRIFGPSDAEAPNSAPPLQWPITLFSNDELSRNRWAQTWPHH